MSVLEKIGNGLGKVIEIASDLLQDEKTRRERDEDKYQMYISRYNSKSDDDLIKMRDRNPGGNQGAALAHVLRQRNLI